MGKLIIEHLTKKIGQTTIVDDLDLTVEDGQLLTVVGPSGCGKTTLLRMVAGFMEPTSGKIRPRKSGISAWSFSPMPSGRT